MLDLIKYMQKYLKQHSVTKLHLLETFLRSIQLYVHVFSNSTNHIEFLKETLK